MNLFSKRVVVSFGNPERGSKPVVENEFPGIGELCPGEKLKNALILSWFWLTHRRVMTIGDVVDNSRYKYTQQSRAFIQLILDMHDLGDEEFFQG